MPSLPQPFPLLFSCLEHHLLPAQLTQPGSMGRVLQVFLLLANLFSPRGTNLMALQTSFELEMRLAATAAAGSGKNSYSTGVREMTPLQTSHLSQPSRML